jgi:heterodisulfide reductase subunit A-like polyferredoxin
MWWCCRWGCFRPGDNERMAHVLDWTLDESGFLPPHGSDRRPAPAGIFTAGTAMGPMTIAESVGSAEKTAFDMIRYLKS